MILVQLEMRVSSGLSARKVSVGMVSLSGTKDKTTALEKTGDVRNRPQTLALDVIATWKRRPGPDHPRRLEKLLVTGTSCSISKA